MIALLILILNKLKKIINSWEGELIFVYIPANQRQKLNESLVGHFGGIGIRFMIYNDTLTVVDVIKGDSNNKIPSSNGLQANLLLLFLIIGLFGGFYYSFGGLEEDFVLPVASKHGVITDTLFWWTMAITGIVFIVTQIFLFGFSWKYQHRENQVAYFYPHNNKLELIWTIIPAIVLAALVFTGWKAWVDITRESPEGSEVIEIMGYQYAWSVRYPGADNVLGNYDYLKIDATNQMGIDFSDRASFDDFIPREIQHEVTFIEFR